jgi:hypothetical protein
MKMKNSFKLQKLTKRRLSEDRLPLAEKEGRFSIVVGDTI